MRLYLLERTPLAALDRVAQPPQPGDLVVYQRAGQDVTGDATRRLEERGVEVLCANRYLTMADARALNAISETFTNGWYIDDDGTDLGRHNGFSLGDLFAFETDFRTNPANVFRVGEVCRRLIADHPGIKRVLSDLTDGSGLCRVAGGLPVGSSVRAAAEQSSVLFTRLDPVDPLEPYYAFQPLNRAKAMLKQFIGGFRPQYLLKRIKLRLAYLTGDDRPAIFVFLGHGIGPLIDRIKTDGRIRVIASQTGYDGTDVLRHDHMAALPNPGQLRAGRVLLKRLEALAARPPDPKGRFAFNGIDYGPLLAANLLGYLRPALPLYLTIVAQAIKMQRIGRFKAAVVNGEGMTGMRAILLHNQETGMPIYCSRHGLNTHKALCKSIGQNYSHITCIASGEDQKDEFGTHLPPAEKPKVVAIGSGQTAVMNPLRGTRSKTHGKRLMIINYGTTVFADNGRAYATDRYTLDTFECARRLLDEGWQVLYRTHPGWKTTIEERMLEELGLAGRIEFDRSPTFIDALPKCDVLIGSVSSTYYQSLYAGWPIVFHEPLADTDDPNEFLDEYFTGLMAAKEIEKPLTRSVEDLIESVRSSLDPESLISRFPEIFTTRYRTRFIGAEPARSDRLIADFILDDLNRQWQTQG